MGRYNFTALHVRRRALQYLETKRTTKSPRWLDVTGDIPPAQILIRTPPQPQPLTRQRLKTLPGKDTPQIVVETVPRRPVKTKKASKLFKPLEMRYEEDELRKEFFQDHPWELARPRVLVESDGKDSRGWDWSKMRQPRKKLDGERFVIFPSTASDLGSEPNTHIPTIASFNANCTSSTQPPTSQKQKPTTSRAANSTPFAIKKTSSAASRKKRPNPQAPTSERACRKSAWS